MKIQIDVKSAVCGLIIGIAVMFTIGADSSNPVGKYQIQTGGGSGLGYAVVIDTQTGEVWGMSAGKNWYGEKPEKFWDAK